jgi:hypothetical protein
MTSPFFLPDGSIEIGDTSSSQTHFGTNSDLERGEVFTKYHTLQAPSYS